MHDMTWSFQNAWTPTARLVAPALSSRGTTFSSSKLRSCSLFWGPFRLLRLRLFRSLRCRAVILSPRLHVQDDLHLFLLLQDLLESSFVYERPAISTLLSASCATGWHTCLRQLGLVGIELTHIGIKLSRFE